MRTLRFLIPKNKSAKKKTVQILPIVIECRWDFGRLTKNSLFRFKTSQQCKSKRSEWFVYKGASGGSSGRCSNPPPSLSFKPLSPSFPLFQPPLPLSPNISRGFQRSPGEGSSRFPFLRFCLWKKGEGGHREGWKGGGGGCRGGGGGGLCEREGGRKVQRGREMKVHLWGGEGGFQFEGGFENWAQRVGSQCFEKVGGPEGVGQDVWVLGFHLKHHSNSRRRHTRVLLWWKGEKRAKFWVVQAEGGFEGRSRRGGFEGFSKGELRGGGGSRLKGRRGVWKRRVERGFFRPFNPPPFRQHCCACVRCLCMCVESVWQICWECVWDVHFVIWCWEWCWLVSVYGCCVRLCVSTLVASVLASMRQLLSDHQVLFFVMRFIFVPLGVNVGGVRRQICELFFGPMTGGVMGWGIGSARNCFQWGYQRGSFFEVASFHEHRKVWVILVYVCVKFRVQIGSILGPFWVHFGSILGPFWVFWCPFWVHFGSILGPFWVHFGSILGPFWVHSGSILGVIWILMHL